MTIPAFQSLFAAGRGSVFGYEVLPQEEVRLKMSLALWVRAAAKLHDRGKALHLRSTGKQHILCQFQTITGVIIEVSMTSFAL